MDSTGSSCGVRGNFCIVCKCTSTRTHHIFPKGESERKKWLEILNLKEEDLKKNARICNEHFNPDCYSPLMMSRPRLFRGSLPNPVTPTSEDQMSTETSSKTNSRIQVDNISVKDIASSSHIKSSNLKRTKRMCFVGDIYFPLVKRANRKFKIAKGIIQKQRKKIKLLQQKNHRLRLKIANLWKLLRLRKYVK